MIVGGFVPRLSLLVYNNRYYHSKVQVSLLIGEGEGALINLNYAKAKTVFTKALEYLNNNNNVNNNNWNRDYFKVINGLAYSLHYIDDSQYAKKVIYNIL